MIAKLAITLLFSLPASHGVPAMPPPPNTPHFVCQLTSGGTYEVCCVWNQHENVIGGWDCTTFLADRRARHDREFAWSWSHRARR